jgi:hypothetical protein
MKNKIITLLVLAMATLPAFSQTASSTVGVTAQVVSTPSQTIQQNYAAVDPGQGRWFVPPAQPYSAPVVPYFGPWTTGANIIEDLRVLPEVLTFAQAKSLYVGGVRARINRMADGSYQFKTCRLMNSLPMKALLAPDGSTVTAPDGKPVMIPDEAKFQRIAYIFLQGNKKANTVDVIAKAAMEAMKAGANGIYLVKKVTSTSTSSVGWGVGLGSVTGTLSGAAKDTSEAASAGTGFNKATTTPVYREGVVVLAVRE